MKNKVAIQGGPVRHHDIPRLRHPDMSLIRISIGGPEQRLLRATTAPFRMTPLAKYVWVGLLLSILLLSVPAMAASSRSKKRAAPKEVPPVVQVSTEVQPAVLEPVLSTAPELETKDQSQEPAVSDGKPLNGIEIEKVTVDDSGNRLLVLMQTSRDVQSFIFERNDPPSLFIQFMSTRVFTNSPPIQVVGIDPLSEIRYGYKNLKDAASVDPEKKEERLAEIEYIELRLTRPVFYHVQQEGWVLVVGLDRTTTKVEVPELDFRFDTAKYVGMANLPANPRADDYVQTALANSQLLAVTRDEVELSKYRVKEAQRALMPAVSAKVNTLRGVEVNPFPSEIFEGFEEAAFKRDEYGLQMNYPLFRSGRLWGAFRQAKLNRLMALENLRKQAQDLSFEVKKAFFNLLKNQASLQVRQQLVAQGELIKDMVEKKFNLDITSKSEVLNVMAQADQAHYQLVGDEQDVTLARLVLISLLNQSADMPDPVPGELSYQRLSFNVESLISWAKDHRPDVRIARLNAELALYNFKAAKADQGVRVDASGFYGKSGAAFEDDDFTMQKAWNVGLFVSKPFWGNTVKANYYQESDAPDLGQAFVTNYTEKSLEVGILDAMPAISNSRQAQLQYMRSKAELVEASRKAEYEVRETYYNLEKSARQLEAVREDLNFKKKDLEITREKVKLGLAESSQLITAEVAYSQALITEQEALSAYNVSLAEMDRVAGAEVVNK